MVKPKVSLIIPTYNRAELLPLAVRSAQLAGGDPEIIVVDDASTDSTSDVCRLLENIRVVRLKKNVGLAAARNAGIEASTGEFIALLDDDDQRLPNSLPAQVAALESKRDAVLCYGKVFLGDSRSGAATDELIPKELPTGDIFWRLLRGNFIPALSVLLRRESLFAAGLFDARLRQVEDWDLWLRMSERGAAVALDQPVAIYRMFEPKSGQLSSNRALMARVAAAVQQRALRLPRACADQPRARECREKFLAETCYTLRHETIAALFAGEVKSARANLLALLKLQPANLRRAEFRELAALAFSRKTKDPRAYEKRLKAARKKLWADGPPT